MNNYSIVTHVRSKAFSISLMLVLFKVSVLAASHTWSGAVNGNFSNAGNWSSGGVPTLSETNSITFPAGATRTTVTNDIGALKVSAFTFSGSNYIVRSASTITVEPSLINFLCSGSSNTVECALTFVSSAYLSIGSGNSLVLSGILSGTNGLTKAGAGKLFFKGAASNPLSGDLTVYSGNLHFQKTGGASPYNGNSITIGTTNVTDPTQLYLYANDQIPDGADISIQPSGSLELNGYTDQVHTVTMYSGYINMGAGTLGINGDLNLTPRFVSGVTWESPTILGALEFIGSACNISVSTDECDIDANIVENGTVTALNKTGPGKLGLKGAGGFTGALNVTQGRVIAYSSGALGSISGATTVSDGATLEVRTGVSSAEPLSLTGLGDDGQGALQGNSATMSGTITLTGETGIGVVNSIDTLNLDGPIGGTGGIRKFGDGTVSLNGFGNNSFAGASFVARGRLTLNKGASVRAVGSISITNGAQVVLNANEQVDNAGVVTIYTGGLFSMTNHNETIGGLNLGDNTTLDTGAGTLTLAGDVFAGPPYGTNYNTPYTLATIRGNLSLGGAVRTFTPRGMLIRLDCPIMDGTGTGGIRMQGYIAAFNTGQIELLRSNTFTGPAIVSHLSCLVSNSFVFGAPGGGVTIDDWGFISMIHPTMSVTGETLTCSNHANDFTPGLKFTGTNAWNGPIFLTNNSISFQTTNDSSTLLTVNGSISGNGGVSIFGHSLSNVVRFTSANSHTGITDILSGTLAIQNPQGLGATNMATRIFSPGQLQLELTNGAVIANESLEADGDVTLAVTGAVSNTWTGSISFENQTPYVSVPTGGTLKLAGAITNFSGVTKIGGGALYYSGGSSNVSYAGGDTIVNDGTLYLDKANNVPATANLVVNYPGKVVWNSNEQIADTASVTLQSVYATSTNIDLANHSETFTHLNILGGVTNYIASAGGTLGLLGNITTSNTITRFAPKLVFSAGPHQVLGDYNAYLYFLNSIQESGGAAGLEFIKCDPYLSASNSFSGPLVMSDGSLTVQHTNALGTSAGSTTLTNYSLIYLDLPANAVVADEALILAPLSEPDVLYEVRIYNHVTNTWTGPITLLQPCRIFNYETNGQLVLTGSITGNKKLVNTSLGTLVLAGNTTNSFNGLTVSAGTVHLAKPAGVPAMGGDLLIDPLSLPAPTVVLHNSGQLPTGCTVSNRSIGVFDLDGYSTTIRQLLGDGSVIGNGQLTISNSLGGYDTDFAGIFNGTLVKQGSGAASFSGSFQNGDLFVQGGLVNRTCNGAVGQTAIAAGAAVYSSGANTFNLGALSGAGTLLISGNNTWVGTGGSSTFAGTISGTNGTTTLTKLGSGALTLTGPVSLVSTTLVQNGTLFVNTTMNNPVVVTPLGGGNLPTLAGNGTVGDVTLTGTGARIAPGASTNTPSYGTLHVNNLTMGSGALYLCELGGTNAGVNLDQIDAAGTVTLSGGAAGFSAFGAGAVSNRYAAVKSVSAVSGTFLNDPEGDTIFPAAGRVMTITYLTSGGKEISLLEQPGANLANIQIATISITNGMVKLTGIGNIGSTYFIEANTNLATTNWVPLGSILGDFNGGISFTDTNSMAFPQRFYRFRLQ